MKGRTKVLIITLVEIILVTATVSALVSVTQLTKDTGIFFAPQYADSGIGTSGNPYVNCLYNSYNLMGSNFKGEIYFPKGYFLETHPMIFDLINSKPRHVTLSGPGFWDSTIKCSANMSGPLITVINGASLYITGLTIIGNKDMNVKCPLIYLKNSFDVCIRDTFIGSCKGDGIQIGSYDGSQRPWTTDIINCPIEYCDGHGINISGATNLYMESLTLSHNKGYEINTEGVGVSHPGFRLVGSYVEAEFNDAIRLGKDTIATITGNTFDGTWKYRSIVFDGTASKPIRSVIITDNMFIDKTALYFTSTNKVLQLTMEDNDFTVGKEPYNLPMTVLRGNMVNNPGFNPLGKYSNPFYYSSSGDGAYLINFYGGVSVPVKNAMYTQQITPARIVSNGGTNVNISVYDGKGNLMKCYGSSCDITLGVGQGINFGNYGVAPSVSVYFE